ncbi:MAG: carboxypeptidase-like regulatory domain-containing protein [Flavobacteriales bacterium]|nr:carboxypeptidase-like regulatory domain-containing protein [Flavobacteriales bacterium]
MKNLFSFIAILFLTNMFAQKGTISGTLTDKDMNNETLPFANVMIQGTTIGTTSDMDGTYSLSVEPGQHTIVFSFLGYKTEMETVTVVAGKNTVVNKAMGADSVQLEDVVVVASVNREKETALLLEQKKATKITQSIGAQELSKKAVSDAAGATMKVTGVNKQEGSGKIYVRGLGDRYNSSTLNDLPLPSNDPQNKNIDLSLFSTGMIQNVGINKAFTSDNSLDVGGANVNIVSKEISGKTLVNVGVSSGYNSQTTGNRFQRMYGSNFLGVNSNTTHQISDLRQYNFINKIETTESTANPNLGASIGLGKRYSIGDEGTLKLFVTGSYDNRYEYREGISHGIVSTTNQDNIFDAKRYTYSATKMALANLGYTINSKNKVSFNHVFIHDNTQKIDDFIGKVADIDRLNTVLQTEVQNRLFINQLLSEHKIGESYDIDFGISYNTIYNDEPDRKRNEYIIDESTNTSKFRTGSARQNSRFYGNLNEDDFASRLVLTKYFGNRTENKGNISAGYNGRITDRTFEAFYFDHDFSANSNTLVSPSTVDNTINQNNLDNSIFAMVSSFGSNPNDPQTYLPQWYSASKKLHSGFVNLVYNFSERFTANVGFRIESVKIRTSWGKMPNPIAELDGRQNQSLGRQYGFPSLNLKYATTEKANLRFASSMTYTYPQFKEIAPFTYEGIDYQETGNPFLKPSANYNADIKYEIFPQSGELITFGAFGKIIENSINRVEKNSAVSQDFTYDNSGNATVLGIEAETKFDVYKTESENNKSKTLSAGANATYMYTSLIYKTPSANSDELKINYTGKGSQLEGASPLTINADVSFEIKNNEKLTLVTLVFNYQSDKVYSLGTNFKQNTVEKGVPILDFVFSHNFNKKFGAKLNIRNLLNQEFERYRDVPEKLTMISYQKGISASLGLSYNL